MPRLTGSINEELSSLIAALWYAARYIEKMNTNELYTIKNCVLRLDKIARLLHNYDTASCNTGLTPRQEKRVVNLENEAGAISKHFGFQFYHQGDPRGWPLYLVAGDEKDISTQYHNGVGFGGNGAQEVDKFYAVRLKGKEAA